MQQGNQQLGIYVSTPASPPPPHPLLSLRVGWNTPSVADFIPKFQFWQVPQYTFKYYLLIVILM
jgi:hypothetical protein